MLTENTLGGIAGGDAKCVAQATAAGLANAANFKAWLSDSSTNALAHVIVTATGPWYRLDGVKIADDKTALTTAPLLSTINYTETGTYVGDQTVWTGTGRAGWSSTGDAIWTNLSDQNCSGTRALYCFEDD